jgi:uroporphyrinogen-III synthase
VPTLLLTRPEPDARAFLAKVREKAGDQFGVLISPVLQIVMTDAPLPPFQRAVLTSVQAVRALGSALHAIEVWCVGAETARAAREADALIKGVAETAQELVEARFDLGGATYFRGEHVAHDLASDLSIAEVIVYRQEARPLSAAAQAMLAGDQAVVLPVFSRRSATIVAAQVVNWRRDVHIIAMSGAVAAEFPADARVSVLDAPTSEQMVDAVVAALKEQG